jgi:LuxR family transcriptional regulator/LuxR family quorum-sensing system transcriptional regulator CciR
MLGNDKKTALSPDEALSIINTLESATTIGSLLTGASKALGVKHSLYQHFTAVGAFDFNNYGNFHPYNVPEEISEFYSKNNKYDRDPVIVAAFAKGRPLWLSDTLQEPYVKEMKHEAMIKWTLKKVGDGLCCPLYGPDNRKAYAFVGFGRDKAEFDPIMPYQIQTLLQIMHVRYCMMIKTLERQVKLTPRESEVLELLSFGKTNREIALILSISTSTVSGYLKKIFLKLDTTDRVSAAMRAQTLTLKL